MGSQILDEQTGILPVLSLSQTTSFQQEIDEKRARERKNQINFEQQLFSLNFVQNQKMNPHVSLETAIGDCGPIRSGETVVIKRANYLADGSLDSAALDEEARFLRDCQMLGIVNLRNYVRGYALVLGEIRTETGHETFNDWIKSNPYRRENHLNTAVLDVLMKLVVTTEQIHKRNIIHRDLKEANILMGGTAEQPAPVIADFGNACYAGTVPQGRKISAGSLTAMPPEQFNSEAQARKESDIYALGVLMYHALTGFPSRSPDELEQFATSPKKEFPKLVASVRDRNDYVSTALAKVVEHCLNSDYAHRPSLAEVRDALSKEQAYAQCINAAGLKGIATRTMARVA